MECIQWHEHLRKFLFVDRDKEKTEQEFADLLVVDNAKVHQNLQDSQSNFSETQVLSPDSSLDEYELGEPLKGIHMEEMDGEAGTTELYRSFPADKHGRSRMRQPSNINTQGRSRPLASLPAWGFHSDSLIEYNSLDAMLREEFSQAASSSANVFRPERKESMDCDLINSYDDDTSETVDEPAGSIVASTTIANRHHAMGGGGGGGGGIPESPISRGATQARF